MRTGKLPGKLLAVGLLALLSISSWSVTVVSEATLARTPVASFLVDETPQPVRSMAAQGGINIYLPLMMRGVPSYLSQERAIDIVVDQVLGPQPPDHDLLGFFWPVMLRQGDTIFPYGDEEEGITVESPQWFFWLDDQPGAFYEHPTRFVFVDATTGHVQVEEQEWWPVLNNASLWLGDQDYWALHNWAFYRLDDGHMELLITDTGNDRVVVTGWHGTITSEIDDLVVPSDAEFGRDERILLAEAGGHRVKVVSRAGGVLQQKTVLDPVDVEYAAFYHDIYVTQQATSTVIGFNELNTVFWQSAGADGHPFVNPYDMEVSSYPDVISVANTGSNELLTLNRSSSLLQQLSQLNDGSPLTRPVDFDILPNGHALVTFADEGNDGGRVVEIDGAGRILFDMRGLDHAMDAELCVPFDTKLIVESGKDRIIQVNAFGDIVHEITRLNDGTYLNAPTDVEVRFLPHLSDVPWIPPDLPVPPDFPEPVERECAIIVNAIYKERLGETTEIDTNDLTDFFGRLGINTRKIGPSATAKQDLFTAIDQMAPSCNDIVLVIEGHGHKSGGWMKVGGKDFKLNELKAKISQYPNVNFKPVIMSCFSGSWLEGLFELDNVTKIITSSDKDHSSYADLDPPGDKNPDDQGSEFMSGFRENLWEAAQNPAEWQSVIADSMQRGIGFKEALLSYAFRSAVDKDVTAGITHPQESEDKPVSPPATHTPTVTRTSTATPTATTGELPPVTYTPTPTGTPTRTRTPTSTRTPTRTLPPTCTRTPTTEPGGTLTGTVVEALTGHGISGATVRVQGTYKSTTTNESGHWTISNVPVGTRTLEVSKSGYTTTTQQVTVVAGTNPTITIALAPVSSDVTIVLNWGTQPADLDAHLGGPDVENMGDEDSRFHIYYPNVGSSPVSYASLDIDDTSGEGPETITIKRRPATNQFVPGTYTFWVHNYSGGPDFGVSNARVRISKGGVEVAQYPVSAEPGASSTTKNLWRVFDLEVDASGQMTIDRSVHGFYDDGSASVFCPGPGGPQSSCQSTPLFYDDFNDPGSGWPVSDVANYKVDYDSGNYRMQVKVPNWAVWASAPIRCGNCIIEVEAWRSTGANSRYGIVFDMNSTRDRYYLFRVQPGRQQYKLQRNDGNWVDLIPYTYSSYINPLSEHNRLKVVRDGANIRLYVNGHYLNSYSDSTYTGYLWPGLYAGSGSTSPVWLRYDDFTVWTVPGLAMEAGATEDDALDAVPSVHDWPDE